MIGKKSFIIVSFFLQPHDFKRTALNETVRLALCAGYCLKFNMTPRFQYPTKIINKK